MVPAARDGSPVAAYAALPPEPELAVVRSHLGTRHRVLDLGAGTGRIADSLAAAGHAVVAVDESAAMLAHVVRARPVCRRIEELALDERFDAVLLLSHLVNGPDPAALLATVSRHLAVDGVVVVQRLEPGRRWRAGSSTAGPVEIELSDLIVRGPEVSARTSYRLGEEVWHQDWVLHERGDAELAALFGEVGLAITSAAGAWVTAAPRRKH